MKRPADKKLGSTDSHWIFSYRGKSPEKPKRFFWSVQGSLRGNRNPLRLFFFCQRFLLEKQKKMLCRTCKFAAVHRPLCSFPETPEASPMRGSCRRRRLMRWAKLCRRKYPHLIRHGSAVPPSPRRGGLRGRLICTPFYIDFHICNSCFYIDTAIPIFAVQNPSYFT